MDKILSDKVIFVILITSVFAVILVAAYQFLVVKEYPFIVEQPCDINVEEGCYERSCEDDECPPNNIDFYKIVKVKASDFSLCSDDTCLLECEAGVIECEQVLCDEDSTDDVCAYYQ